MITKSKSLKNTIIKILKIGVPIAIGLYLTWFFYTNLSEEEKANIPQTFKNANYLWVFLSLLIAWLSHVSRSIRWKYQLNALGYDKVKVKNMYHSVMIGYIMNLTIPRSGEFARGGFFAKKENKPFDKVFGTIVAERVIDVIMLLGVMGFTSLYVGADVLKDLSETKFKKEIVLSEEMASSLNLVTNSNRNNREELLFTKAVGEDFPLGTRIVKIENQSLANLNSLVGEKVQVIYVPAKSSSYLVYYIILALFLGGVTIFFMVNRVKTFVVSKVKGLWEGVKGIFYLKNKWAYLFHTLFIWVCYILMFLVCSFAYEGMPAWDLKMLMVSFVVGGIAMSVTPGGIGLYPLLVTGALVYFGIEKDAASGFSILMWVSQTVFLVLFGLYSLFAINVKFSASEIETTPENV